MHALSEQVGGEIGDGWVSQARENANAYMGTQSVTLCLFVRAEKLCRFARTAAKACCEGELGRFLEINVSTMVVLLACTSRSES